MAEILLQYLTRRNHTVRAFGTQGSSFVYSEDWETVEKLEIWSEFNYEALMSKFGEELQCEVTQFDATAMSEQGGYHRTYDERGLSDIVCMSITGSVSTILGPLLITSGGRTMEELGCYHDWGAGVKGRSNTNGRGKALILGDTKYKWSSTSAIDTVRNSIDGSYEDAVTRDDVRPIEQVLYYGSVYKCRYVFVITDKELVMMQLHLAPDPVRTSPRPVRTTRPLASHQKIISSPTISKQFSDMSIDKADLKNRKLGLQTLYFLVRLAYEDGRNLKNNYPPFSRSSSVPGGKVKDVGSLAAPTASSYRSSEPSTQPSQESNENANEKSAGTPSRTAADTATSNRQQYIDVKVSWNSGRTEYIYAVGDPKVSDNYIVNDPPGNWTEMLG
ncbi:hypothetical protein BDW69DRAFT_180516 [Aspergillus filifer]